MVDFINRSKNMSYTCENALPLKTLLEICLQNIAFKLSLHLMMQKYSRFNELISMVSTLQRRLLDHKCERKGNTVVNKIESTMVGTKKLPTKLKVKYTIETTKPVE